MIITIILNIVQK